jgi:DNA polymerase-1
MKTALLVDGNNLAFASNCSPRLTNSNGFPVQGIKAFFQSLSAAAGHFKATGIAVAFDGGRSEWRCKLYPEYKATRDARIRTPQEIEVMEDFRAQMPLIVEGLGYLGIPVLSGNNVEADDIIAELAWGYPGDRAVVFSSDKDFLQLVSPKTSIYSTLQAANPRHINFDNMLDAKGLAPGQWLDYRAMTGDKSDNIPGVRGVGEKTALGIIKKYGSVQNFLYQASICPPSNSYERKVVAGVEELELSKKLMLLGLNGDRDKVRVSRSVIDNSRARRFFAELEILSIAQNFDAFLAGFAFVEK